MKFDKISYKILIITPPIKMLNYNIKLKNYILLLCLITILFCFINSCGSILPDEPKGGIVSGTVKLFRDGKEFTGKVNLNEETNRVNNEIESVQLIIKVFGIVTPKETFHGSIHVVNPVFPYNYKVINIPPNWKYSVWSTLRLLPKNVSKEFIEGFSEVDLNSDNLYDLATGMFPDSCADYYNRDVEIYTDKETPNIDINLYSSRDDDPCRNQSATGKGNLKVSVTYNGLVGETDRLRGILFKEPNLLSTIISKSANIKNPQFPVDINFKEVNPGTYYLYIYLDIEGNSPSAPDENDIGHFYKNDNSETIDITLESDKTLEVEFNLE